MSHAELELDRGALTLSPIGVVRSPFRDKASVPRQPAVAGETRGTIELCKGRHLEDAVDGLASFSAIWLLFWFHQNGDVYRPKVQPPRANERVGVLATRSPHRPNPLGLSLLALERVEGLTLHVRGVDVLDGTPVLDVKPFLPYTDVARDGAGGWLEASTDRGPRFDLAWAESARSELEFLGEAFFELRATVETLLSTGPQPHAYRRIKQRPDGSFRLAVKSWRFDFVRDGERHVTVTAIRSGYRPAQLFTTQADEPPDLALHRAFVARFGLIE